MWLQLVAEQLRLHRVTGTCRAPTLDRVEKAEPSWADLLANLGERMLGPGVLRCVLWCSWWPENDHCVVSYSYETWASDIAPVLG